MFTMMREGVAAPSARGCTAINASWAPIDPYAAYIRVLHSAYAAPVGFNWGRHADPVTDAALDKVLAEFDPVKQAATLRALHEHLVDDDVAIFIAHDLNPRALGPKVQGFVQAQSWFQDLTPIRLA